MSTNKILQLVYKLSRCHVCYAKTPNRKFYQISFMSNKIPQLNSTAVSSCISSQNSIYSAHLLFRPPRNSNLNVSSQYFHERNNASTEDNYFDEDTDLKKADKAFDIINSSLKITGRIPKRMIELALDHVKHCSNLKQFPSFMLFLLRCCGEKMYEDSVSERMILVDDIWTMFSKSDVKSSLVHYNSLLHVYVENEHVFDCVKIMKEIEDKGLEPDYDTYVKFILGYCQLGDVEGANTILDKMKEKNIAISSEIFEGLTMGHCRANDFESARETVAMMPGENLNQNYAYVILLKELARKGMIEELETTYNECVEKGIYINDLYLFETIYCLTSNGHEKHVGTIMSKLHKDAGYRMDCTNTVYRLLASGYHAVAFDLLLSMNAPVFIDGTQMGSGFFFLKHLTKLDIPLDVLVSYCRKISSVGVHPYAFEMVFRSLFQASTNNASKCFQLIEEMQKDEIKIREHYFWPMLVAFAEMEDWDMFYKSLRKMQELKLLNYSTLSRFVIKFIFKPKDNLDSLYKTFEENEILMSSQVVGVIIDRILHETLDLKTAVEICSKYNHLFLGELVHHGLLTSLVETKQAKDAVNILSYIIPTETNTADRENSDRTYSTFRFLKALAMRLRRNNYDFSLFTEVLKEMELKGGFFLNDDHSKENISNQIGVQYTDEMDQLLNDLTYKREDI